MSTRAGNDARAVAGGGRRAPLHVTSASLNAALRNLVIFGVLAAVAACSWWLTRDDDEPGAAAESEDRAPAVLVTEITRQRYADEIEALGTTRAAESVDITARVSKVITGIQFTEGEWVERGELLVELENSEALADHAAAQSALVESRSQYDRSRELLGSGGVSESRVEELEAVMLADEAAVRAAEARLQDHRLRAPFSGVTGLRRVSVGALVSPGAIITTLDDVSTVLLDFDVPESHMSGLEVGQTLDARSVAYPDDRFAGTVATIDSRVDPVTRAVTVRARLPNPDGLLKPGMFMTVRVLREASEILLVPEQALVPMQSRQYLYVVEDGVAGLRQVTIGRRIPGSVEVVGGLEAGEVVVIEGTQRLRDGMAVDPRPWQEPG